MKSVIHLIVFFLSPVRFINISCSCGHMDVVLLRISKSCKRTDSDWFSKKSADPDSVSDSGWKYYKHVFTDVWFGIRTSNGRKWRKSIPLADNKHCYVVVVVYLWVSENGVSAILTGFWWYKFKKWGEKNFQHTFQNRHFRPPKIRGFGLGRTGEKFADSDANSESVTTLDKLMTQLKCVTIEVYSRNFDQYATVATSLRMVTNINDYSDRQQKLTVSSVCLIADWI